MPDASRGGQPRRRRSRSAGVRSRAGRPQRGRAPARNFASPAWVSRCSSASSSPSRSAPASNDWMERNGISTSPRSCSPRSATALLTAPVAYPPIGLSSAPEGPAPPGGQRDGPPRSGRRRARHLGGGPSRRRCRRARSGSAGRRSRHRGGLHRALVRLPDGPSTASRRMTQDRGHGLGGPASTSSGPRTAPRDHTARSSAGRSAHDSDARAGRRSK